MSGYITPKNNNGWDPEKDSWDEYKANRFSGQQGIGMPNIQKNARGMCPQTDLPKRTCRCRTW